MILVFWLVGPKLREVNEYLWGGIFNTTHVSYAVWLLSFKVGGSDRGECESNLNRGLNAVLYLQVYSLQDLV